MNKTLIIIYVLRILEEFSDENHPLTQGEINEKLKLIYGKECDRKTIAEKIDSLIFAGYDIVKNSGGGCYLASREFEPSEISFLIDAVFSSKAIDSKKSRDLSKKLYSFLSKHQRKKYNYIYKSDEVARTTNKQLFYTIDVLHEAIENHKQVEFYYEKPFVSKNLQDKQNERKYIINPYFLVNNQGKYYLVCNNAWFNDVANYRIEQIKDIKIIDKPIKSVTELKGYEKGLDIAKYVNENIYMFSNNTVNATLKLSSEYAVSMVLDWFNKNAKVYTQNNYLYADVKADEMALVYWCLQYGEWVELISPTETKEKIRKQVELLKRKYN